MRKPSTWLIALCFLVAVGGAIAARNNAGSYSLPAGNPVVSGSTISSSWANNTLSDISTEITNSLDRYGRGAMLAPILTPDGTAAAPGHSFTSEQGSGLYRAASNDVRMAIGGGDIEKWNTSGVTVTGSVTAGAVSSSAGVTVTQSTANSAGLTAIGNGTGIGVNGTGGSGGASGGKFTGGGTGYGVEAYGSGTKPAVFASGATYGVQAVGGTGYAGVTSAAGTASTSGAPQDAIVASNGNLSLDGVANPNGTVAVKNRITPKNIVKAWVNFKTNGTAAPTIIDSFNVASVSAGTSAAAVNFAQAFANANYIAVCDPHPAGDALNGSYGVDIAASSTASTASVELWQGTAGKLSLSASSGQSIHCIFMGAQ